MRLFVPRATKICFDVFYGDDNKVNIAAIRTFLVGVVGEENILSNADAPVVVDEDNTENAIDNTKYSFDGKSRLSKKDLGYNIVKKYIDKYSEKTFAELQSDLAFDDNVNSNSRFAGVLVQSNAISNSYQRYYNEERTSSDGVKYKILSGWTKYNIDFIINFAKTQGWAVNPLTD